MMDWLLKIDYWIFEKINHSGSFAIGDLFFPWVTDLHKLSYFMWLAVPLMIFVFVRKFKKLGFLLFFNLLIALACNDYMGSVVKNHYLRLRPFENTEIVALKKSPAGSKSFYSNHTSNMVTFAVYTAQFFPQARIPLYTLAAVVGYSRIYNGVHYPSDVICGAFAGIFWGLLISMLSKKMFLKYTSVKKEEAP